ncbi:hypothetical protein A4U49_07710 [Acidithiobacillus ferrivorans]|jgi:CRISPR type IV-associated protein Csf3|uniref:type IV CRISPR-associated protein Csf3 n=1 Tax=Acidithiobacillus ferrivorans TaxID=160808 RepID=UPI00089375C8|nr:type IV CRISPR-associated protein Csf3 [Acidithiobacillus ferrivorans]OFA16384.1 hypothetical protein A4U49_07710 [Acidithiobacillus ferrivorans]
MEAMEVTFTLATPMMLNSEYPVHLDALIAFAVSRDAEKQGSDHPWEDANDLSDIFDRTAGEGKRWVWKASQLVVTQRHLSRQLYSMTNAVRRTDTGRFFGDLEAGYWRPRSKLNPETFRIQTRKGQQRGYQMYLVTADVCEVKAWAVGEMDAVRYYLGTIDHLGKGGNNGYGKIVETSVSACADEDQWRLRWMPEGEPGKPGVSYAPVNGCLQQPYWEDYRHHRVMEPVI